MADATYQANPNNRRSVKYIADRVLRRIVQATDFKPAMQSDYETVYEHLVDLMTEWQEKGYLVASKIPESLDDDMGNQDPINSIIYVLTVRIAPYYSFEPTQAQVAQASGGMRMIRNRRCTIPRMCKPSRMPRGSGNRFFDGLAVCDDQVVLNNQGVPIVT